jgi:hypothetical protein
LGFNFLSLFDLVGVLRELKKSVGATLKAFIRPSEDDENPYSTQKSPIIVIIFYFLFLFFFVVWIFLFTCKVDQRFVLNFN